MIQTLQTICGNTGGPMPNTDTYQNELLRNAIVHFIIVNNVPENGLHPAPGYTASPLEATITRMGGNVWIAGDKIIIVYSKCAC
jgi:hypothetical protein